MPRPPLAFDPIEEARRQWDLRSPKGAPMAAATSLMRAQQIVLAAVDKALRPLDLSFARYEALVLLSFTRRGALPLGKMGDRLMIKPASVTNIVDRLEGQGLARRVPDPRDGRGTLAAITPAGRRLVKRATAAVESVDFGLEPLARRDLETLTAILQRLRAATGDFRST